MSVLNTETLETKVNGFAKKNKIIRLQSLSDNDAYQIEYDRRVKYIL